MSEVRSLEGRSDELIRLERFLVSMSTRATVMVLEGEPGIGKTVLWEEAIDRARERGWRAMTCRPGEFESDLVFAALADLLDPFAPLIEELPSVARRALRAALLLEDPPPDGIDQRAVGRAVLLLLRRLGEAGPLLVAVDDLQWIDTATERVLRFAMRRIEADPVGLLATVRVSPSSVAPASPEWPASERVTIGPMDASSIEALLRARVSRPLRRATVRHIFELSGGNPFFALELAHADGSHDRGVETPTSLPTSLEAAVGDRLARLPRPTREGLLLIAVLGEQPAHVMRQVLAEWGLDASVLDAAFAMHVVLEREGQIRFSHPLMRSMSYWGCATQQRSDAHRLVGRILHDTPAGLVHQAIVAEVPDEALAASLERAAGGIAVRGAPDAAARLLADAVRLTPADQVGDLVRRAVACADRHMDAGETATAISVLRNSHHGLSPGVHRAEVLHGLARAVGRVDGFRASGALLIEALDQTADDLRLRCAIERDLSNAMSNYGDLGGALAHGELARRHASELDDVELLHGADVEVAVTGLFLGLGAPADIDARASAALARLSQGGHVKVNAHMLEAMTWAAMLKWTDRFDMSRMILGRLTELLEERDEDGLTVPVLFQLGELCCWSGELSSASRLASSCAETAIATGQQAWIVMSLYLRALVDAERGSVEAARAAAAEGLQMAERQDDARMIIRQLHVLGALELSGRDPARGAAHLTAATSIAQRCGYVEPGVFRIDADAIEALVAARRLEEAEDRTVALEAAGQRLARPYALVTSARCRALLHFARGELDDAIRYASQALVGHDALAQPVERGRTLLLEGTILRRQRHKAAARTALDSALSLFLAHGADAWAAVARRELARISGRPPAPQALTASEQAVADLVATGKRNREIAAELHLSEKTVEANLTRVYRKLGIRSRSELSASRRGQT